MKGNDDRWGATISADVRAEYEDMVNKETDLYIEAWF